jgi:hypothetical protein
MAFSFDTHRFHVETGPDALFERVRHVMTPTDLQVHADHFQKRAAERDVPVEAIRSFDPTQSHWELKTAEVRTDSGKFVSTGWQVRADGETWWVVIGLKDTIITVYRSDKQGLGDNIVRDGMLYAYVRSVNRGLIQSES